MVGVRFCSVWTFFVPGLELVGGHLKALWAEAVFMNEPAVFDAPYGFLFELIILGCWHI